MPLRRCSRLWDQDRRTYASLLQAMVPLRRGKPTLTPNYWAVCRILCTLILCGSNNFALAASSSDGSCKLNLGLVGNSIGCMPSSQKHLVGYYIEKQNSLPATDFHRFLSSDLCSHNCQGLTDGMSGVLGLSELLRDLIGEGSHRHLASTMIFNIQPDMMSWFAVHFCEAMVIERLPIGVFADPFELQHLVQRQIYLDAAVFGDTNLELPSALSNRSVVEVHIAFENGNLLKGSELVLELPLHARYPPLDGSGYSRVEIGAPDLFVRCRPKSSKNEASNWKLVNLVNLDTVSGKNVTWPVPCGDKGHTGFVSIVTFVSALFSAFVLVFSALYFTNGDDTKNS